MTALCAVRVTVGRTRSQNEKVRRLGNARNNYSIIQLFHWFGHVQRLEFRTRRFVYQALKVDPIRIPEETWTKTKIMNWTKAQNGQRPECDRLCTAVDCERRHSCHQEKNLCDCRY